VVGYQILAELFHDIAKLAALAYMSQKAMAELYGIYI
jgi:hypothetical protein